MPKRRGLIINELSSFFENLLFAYDTTCVRFCYRKVSCLTSFRGQEARDNASVGKSKLQKTVVLLEVLGAVAASQILIGYGRFYKNQHLQMLPSPEFYYLLLL